MKLDQQVQHAQNIGQLDTILSDCYYFNRDGVKVDDVLFNFVVEHFNGYVDNHQFYANGCKRFNLNLDDPIPYPLIQIEMLIAIDNGEIERNEAMC